MDRDDVSRFVEDDEEVMGFHAVTSALLESERCRNAAVGPPARCRNAGAVRLNDAL